MSTSDEKVRLSSGEVLSTAERYLERALFYLSKKKYRDAILDLNEAIKIERHNAELLATRGYVHLQADDAKSAEEDFRRATKIDPSQWIVYYARAYHAFEKEDYNAVLQHTAEMQRFVPLRPELYILRAAAYYHLGNKRFAQQEIDSAMQVMQPDDDRNKQARSWQRTIKKM